MPPAGVAAPSTTSSLMRAWPWARHHAACRPATAGAAAHLTTAGVGSAARQWAAWSTLQRIYCCSCRFPGGYEWERLCCWSIVYCWGGCVWGVYAQAFTLWVMAPRGLPPGYGRGGGVPLLLQGWAARLPCGRPGEHCHQPAAAAAFLQVGGGWLSFTVVRFYRWGVCKLMWAAGWQHCHQPAAAAALLQVGDSQQPAFLLYGVFRAAGTTRHKCSSPIALRWNSLVLLVIRRSLCMVAACCCCSTAAQLKPATPSC